MNIRNNFTFIVKPQGSAIISWVRDMISHHGQRAAESSSKVWPATDMKSQGMESTFIHVIWIRSTERANASQWRAPSASNIIQNITKQETTKDLVKPEDSVTLRRVSTHTSHGPMAAGSSKAKTHATPTRSPRITPTSSAATFHWRKANVFPMLKNQILVSSIEKDPKLRQRKLLVLHR